MTVDSKVIWNLVIIVFSHFSIFSPLGVRILPNFPMMERFTFIHVKFIILYKAEMHMSRNLFDLSLDHCQKLFAKTPYALVSEVLEGSKI